MNFLIAMTNHCTSEHMLYIHIYIYVCMPTVNTSGGAGSRHMSVAFNRNFLNLWASTGLGNIFDDVCLNCL
jgi:hypothetical protein